LPQLRDAQLQGAKASVEGTLTVAVAPGNAFAATLVASGTDYAFDVALHQQLQHRLGHRSQKISVAGLLQKFGQHYSFFGHRSSRVSG
jgi:hypothetical protein